MSAGPGRVTAAEAVATIPDGATIAISGGLYRACPEILLAALEQRFLSEGSPRGVTAVAMSMIERTRAGKGGEGTGLNRLAHHGLATSVICSSFSRGRERSLNKAIRDGHISAHAMSMGGVVQWLRAVGSGEAGLWTQVGIGTFLDPRVDGGVMGPAGRDAPLPRISVIEGEEHLFYPTRPVDVALIKGTSADERGNVFFDREAFNYGARYMAMAARASGGKVIAQVNRLVGNGELHPRFGQIPAPLVDAVVVDPEVWEDEQDPGLVGESFDPARTVHVPGLARTLVAERVLEEIGIGACVNVGAGIPMYELASVAKERRRGDIYFTIEQGPMGGAPEVGGVQRGPAIIWDSLETFDFYHGGCADVACLSFGQVDGAGNVNVSRFGDLMPGCGGFPDIAHRTKRIVLCGTLVGRSQAMADGPAVRVPDPSGTVKFVPEVEHITFNGRRAIEKGASVRLVTERAVFDFDRDGWRLTELAQGVDHERDVRPFVAFDYRAAESVVVRPVLPAVR